MKTSLFSLLFILIGIVSCSPYNLSPEQKSAHKWSKRSNSTLNYPYGTVLEMKVQIVDGDSLYSKQFWGDYLVKVLEINGKRTTKTYVFEFDNFFCSEMPKNNFELYENLYGEETEVVRDSTRKAMKAQYVGATFNVAAYESGRFIGIPDGWGKYDIVPGGIKGLVFKNYLVIITTLE